MSPVKRKNNNRLIYKKLISPFIKERTRAVVNPFLANEKQKHDVPTSIFLYDYDSDHIDFIEDASPDEIYHFYDTPSVTWLNIDGINKPDIEKICNKFQVHALIQEDILSYGQRPKMDDVESKLYVLLNMLYYNPQTCGIEQEQISILLAKNMVISFQEDASRDVFDPIREKLKIDKHKIRLRGADYLFYSLVDEIVDSYFHVIEKLGERIEIIEEQLLQKANRNSIQSINQLRKEIILLKRNTTPVRDLVSGFMRSESDLLDERTIKYFKDVYDHIVQANELTENYRDMVMSLQDLYINSVNLRMNDVMKTLAIVTTVMAPATVIGGIFGMNFDVIPYAHQQWGFYATVFAMIIIPIFMIFWFRSRGWFEKDLPHHEDEPKELF
ncbi:MAG: magnesium/cobalt transporter CorA [Bacteroidota bacterium]